jgi:hypothetical protein
MLTKMGYSVAALTIAMASANVYAAPVKPKTASAAAASLRYPPRDECLAIDGYFELRQNLEGIIKRRDKKALLAMASENIKWSFGGDGGKLAFETEWKLNEAKSPIWAELDKIIRLGCAAEDKYVTMPHFFAQEIPGAQGVGSAALVLGPEVKLRTGPSTSTAIKAVMNWDVVELGEKDPSGAWTAVKTTDGKNGYIRNDYLRNQIDYRIGFERTAKGWQIAYFIAGD